MRKGFIIAVLFVVAVNAMVLAGVVFNRSGSPTSELRLSARELQLVRPSYPGASENSALLLRIGWQYPAGGWKAVLDRHELESLGFDLSRVRSKADRSRYPRSWSRERAAYVVLEYQGKAWQQLLESKGAALARSLGRAKSDAQRKFLQDAFERFQQTASRLVLVDAGADPVALRARYPERSQYLITRASIRAYLRYPGRDQGPSSVLSYVSVVALLPAKVSVPHRYRPFFHTATSTPYRRSRGALPDYRVKLAYGRRYQPWIVAVSGTPRD